MRATDDVDLIVELTVPTTAPGDYDLLTSAGITSTFDSVSVTGSTPSYTISYLPAGAPTHVQLDLIDFGGMDRSTASVDVSTASGDMGRVVAGDGCGCVMARSQTNDDARSVLLLATALLIAVGLRR